METKNYFFQLTRIFSQMDLIQQKDEVIRAESWIPNEITIHHDKQGNIDRYLRQLDEIRRPLLFENGKRGHIVLRQFYIHSFANLTCLDF